MSRFVLLPAFPLDCRMWASVRQDLEASGHEVLCIDIGGLGNSEIPTHAQPSVDAMAEQAAAAIHAAGWDSAHVAGISMGGYVAMAMLRVAPEYVSGLALVSTRASADSPARRAERLAQASALDARSLEVLARTMSVSLLSGDATAQSTADVSMWIREQNPAAVAWCLAAMATRPDSLSTLRSAGARPVVVVTGAADEITTAVDAQQMLMACRDAGSQPTYVEISGVGHLTVVESPTSVVQAIQSLT